MAPRTITLDDLMVRRAFTPNDGQRVAIEHRSGPLFVVAGPGSGKTRVLLWRTVNLIACRGVDPARIFLATFTEKAATQLKDGLVGLLAHATEMTGRPYDISDMYVGTFHSLCARLLEDRRFTAGRRRADVPHILDAVQQYFHLAEPTFWRAVCERLGTDEGALRSLIGDRLGDNRGVSNKHQAVSALISLFNRLSEEDLDPVDLLAQCDDEDVRTLFELYDCYLESLEGAQDLSLLQRAAYRAVRDARSSVPAFDYVIVDEYQDTNAVQERLYFKLAEGAGNLCVVGDDDQALYRFRGATVENFVQFPERCRSALGAAPTRVELSINYRSRRTIVEYSRNFIGRMDWSRPDGGDYRLADKQVVAHSQDSAPAVITTTPAPCDEVADEVADLIARLLAEKRVDDPSQIAVLFPSLKAKPVERLERALLDRDIKVYAPRARRFLEAEEPSQIVGLFANILGLPRFDMRYARGEYGDFIAWLRSCERDARELIDDDPLLRRFVDERQAEIDRAVADLKALRDVLIDREWADTDTYDPDVHKRPLIGATGLSTVARRGLGTRRLDEIVKTRRRRYDEANATEQAHLSKPFTLRYIINRATAFNWGVLDLFYRLLGFEHFRPWFEEAERGADEGPICNLALTSQYLGRFLDQFPGVLTATSFESGWLSINLFTRFLLPLFRLGEGEYEDADDPFPKGRVPFLTIHQSKGLEFPVVVLGSVYPPRRQVRPIEDLVAPYTRPGGEPLERMADFDAMRMFYVALSRAENLLVVTHRRGRGQRTEDAFKPLFRGLPVAGELAAEDVPAAPLRPRTWTRRYSYTADYLAYQSCPRRYMMFRKYGFVPSRTQTMMFGSLVHATIEDLHNFLIDARSRTPEAQ